MRARGVEAGRGQQRRRVWAAAVAAAAVAAGVAGVQQVLGPDHEVPVPRAEQVQQWSGTAELLRVPGQPLLLCGGATLASYPPAGCGGVPVRGVDRPEDLPGAKTVNGTLFTESPVRLVGSWDGRALTVTRPPVAAPRTDPPQQPPERPLCRPPAGGWSFDAYVQRDRDRAFAYVRRQPDGGATAVDGDERIAVLGFTGDLERHEREVRALYDGPLCVVRTRYSLREMEAAHRSVQRELRRRGIQLFSAGQQTLGQAGVHVQVDAVDAATASELRRTYGPILVLDSFLRPL